MELFSAEARIIIRNEGKIKASSTDYETQQQSIVDYLHRDTNNDPKRVLKLAPWEPCYKTTEYRRTY